MPLKNVEIRPGTPGSQQLGDSGAEVKETLNVGRILLPVDFTERSIGAARCAADLAQRFVAEVTLLQVAAPVGRRSGGLSNENAAPAHSESRIQRRVGEVLRTVPFRRISLTGDPATQIIEYARQENSGLIVMPTRGRRCWAGWFDSTTARVIRGAPCPVWTSVNYIPEPLRIRRVLCALALAPSSGGILQWASQFADRFDASLTIVHSDSGFADLPGAWNCTEMHTARQAWARQDISALQNAAGTRADVWLEAGRPERAVAVIAGRIGADLVVIGKSPSFRLLGRLWTRPYDIACEAPCPVVIC